MIPQEVIRAKRDKEILPPAEIYDFVRALAENRISEGQVAAFAMAVWFNGMSRDEIDLIPPVDGADALFTLLPNGDNVRISKKAVEGRANAQLAKFRQEGIDVVMLACTGKFPNLTPEGLVILPSAVLHKMVEAVLPKGRLGVFSPLAEQTALIAGKWQREGVEVVGVTLQPGSDDASVDAAAREMAAKSPDLVVLDCMSYTSANKARVRRHHAGPVILSIAAAARVVEELVS